MDCKNVLVIEDDEAVRQSIQDVLELKGYHTLGATDGQDAIQKLNKENAPCVILLDMMMPGMNGWQFLDFQRSSPDFAGIPVIICSALTETARSIKPAAFITKPVQLKSLVDAVRSFCG